MIDAQTLYVVGFVSQATFALTMALLAWSDRRSRGMIWLASAGAMQFLATIFRYALPREPHHAVEAVGGVIVVLIFFFTYKGLRWFVVRKPDRSRGGLTLMLASAALVAGCSLINPASTVVVSRVVVTVTIVVTLPMLWNTRCSMLRFAARVCAATMSLVLFMILWRVCIDSFSVGQQHALLSSWARQGMMVNASLLSLSFISLFVAEGKRRLHEETRTDSLTGLCNRRAMEESAARAILLAHQTRTPLALLMLDMDNFKALNDTWGHWLGDRALHALGSVLLTGTGTRDIAARMGGEEFAVLLPNRTQAEATLVAERLRGTVSEINLNDAGCAATLGVSIGVSVLRPGETSWSDLLRRADKALYRAKREGRNRVVPYIDDVTPINTALHVSAMNSLDSMDSMLTGAEGWSCPPDAVKFSKIVLGRFP